MANREFRTRLLTRWLLPQQYPLLYPSQKSGITMSESQSTSETTEEETPIIDECRVTLVYIDNAGNEHEQPLEDLPTCGTLIDGESGDDMTLIGVRVLTLAEVERRAWAAVTTAMKTAKAMHFDGCHKIYLSMDDEEVSNMEDLGYDIVAPDIALLSDWFDSSCELRSISSVSTNTADPNQGFAALIPQGFQETEPGDATQNVYVS